MYTHADIHTYTHTHIHTHIHTYIHTYIHTLHIYIYICMHIYNQQGECMCLYIPIYRYTCLYSLRRLQTTVYTYVYTLNVEPWRTKCWNDLHRDGEVPMRASRIGLPCSLLNIGSEGKGLCRVFKRLWGLYCSRFLELCFFQKKSHMLGLYAWSQFVRETTLGSRRLRV